jgi:hypothetical protein
METPKCMVRKGLRRTSVWESRPLRHLRKLFLPGWPIFCSIFIILNLPVLAVWDLHFAKKVLYSGDKTMSEYSHTAILTGVAICPIYSQNAKRKKISPTAILTYRKMHDFFAKCEMIKQ